MCGGVHYGEVEGLVSVERWPCSRGVCVWWSTLWGVGGLLSVERWSCSRGVCVWWSTLWGG